MVAGLIGVDAIRRLLKFSGIVAAPLESRRKLVPMIKKPADSFGLLTLVGVIAARKSRGDGDER